jgi:predicted AAA+ superfamily ATPase
LKELLQVAHESVERWIKIFERMHFCFRVPPYGPRNIRAVKKEQKLYLRDWSSIPEEVPGFENFIASHLLKYCHFMKDTEGYEHYDYHAPDADGAGNGSDVPYAFQTLSGGRGERQSRKI